MVHCYSCHIHGTSRKKEMYMCAYVLKSSYGEHMKERTIFYGVFSNFHFNLFSGYISFQRPVVRHQLILSSLVIFPIFHLQINWILASAHSIFFSKNAFFAATLWNVNFQVTELTYDQVRASWWRFTRKHHLIRIKKASRLVKMYRENN